MRALIDGDIVCYRAACSAENDEVWIALSRADSTINMILEETGAQHYTVFLTGSNNFRRDISPSYKAQRPDARPAHWQAIRDYLLTQHRAIMCDGYEADDEMGIQQDKTGGTTVICSIDKDLKQIPGKHYNFVRKETDHVETTQGKKFLYLQSLIGDRSDNIFGVEGIGPVKANKALEGLYSELEWYEKCRELYNDDERFHLNMQLLYIWQKPYDKWLPPTTATREAGNSSSGVADHPPASTLHSGEGEGQQQHQKDKHD